MDKIAELNLHISDIESSITSDMDVQELYDKLVVAYSHAKDIIELQQGNIPLVQDNALEDKLRDAEGQLAEANTLTSTLQTEVDKLQAKFSTLENKLQEARDILG